MVIISSNAGHLTGVKNVSGTITLSCIMTRPPLYLIHPHILTHQSLQNATVKLKCSPLLMTCKVLVRSPSNVMIEARVLLNNESSTSFITEHLVQTLRLPRAHQNVHVLGIAGSSPQTLHTLLPSFAPLLFMIQVMPLMSAQQLCLLLLVICLLVQFPLIRIGAVFLTFL